MSAFTKAFPGNARHNAKYIFITSLLIVNVNLG